MRRWGLKHEGRDFIVYHETREGAVELFAKEMSEIFRLVAPPPIEDIEAGVHELGLHEGAGRVLVDKNPARETRHAHVEPTSLTKIIDDTVAASSSLAEQLKDHLNGAGSHGPLAEKIAEIMLPNSVTALERMKNRAAGK